MKTQLPARYYPHKICVYYVLMDFYKPLIFLWFAEKKRVRSRKESEFSSLFFFPRHCTMKIPTIECNWNFRYERQSDKLFLTVIITGCSSSSTVQTESELILVIMVDMSYDQTYALKPNLSEALMRTESVFNSSD